MKCDTIFDLERFLEIQEQALGATSPEVATTASNLAELYKRAGQLDKAEALHRRALKIRQNLTVLHKEEVEQRKQRLDELLQQKANVNKPADNQRELKSDLSSLPYPKPQDESIISGSNYSGLPQS